MRQEPARPLPVEGRTLTTLEEQREQMFLLIVIPVVVFLFTLLIAPLLFSELPFGLNEWIGSIVIGGR